MSGSNDYDYDVIVVGSGFGGASAAESLACAGLKVAILERGTWWGAFTGHRPLPETVPQLLAALIGVNLSGFGRNFHIPLSRRGLIEIGYHGGTITVNSSAVGGNSVVSGSYLDRPSPQFFEALPPELTAAELEPHYQRIERAQLVSPGPQDERRLALMTDLADKQGWKLGRTPQAIRWKSDAPASQPECDNCNRCAFCCNVGAKQGMDKTLIPKAIKAGAMLRDLCEVQTVEPAPGGYEVRFHEGLKRCPGVLRTPRVVMAAGALNTLKILLRSTVAGGLGTILNLGRHFSMAADTLKFYRVPCDVVPEPIKGHIMDMSLRVPGSGNEFDHIILCGAPPLIPGSWLLRTLQGRHTLSWLGFGPDAMDGQVSWKGRGIVVRHEPQAAVRRIQATMDRIAQVYGWEKPVRTAGSDQRVRPWLSFHPLGGCRMAADASRGVVDFRGEVFGHPGLYVADASVFPTVPIAGPQLSVSALSSWIAERIVKDDG